MNLRESGTYKLTASNAEWAIKSRRRVTFVRGPPLRDSGQLESSKSRVPENPTCAKVPKAGNWGHQLYYFRLYIAFTWAVTVTFCVPNPSVGAGVPSAAFMAMGAAAIIGLGRGCS
jgi:hypothetical protein